MELKNQRSAIIVGIPSPSGHHPPVDQVLPLQMLPPLGPGLVGSPVNLILGACDRYRQSQSLVLQCLLARPAECNSDSGVTLQLSVLSSTGKRIEHHLVRLCSSHTNQCRLRASIRTNRCDHGESVPLHVRQHRGFAERFHRPTLSATEAESRERYARSVFARPLRRIILATNRRCLQLKLPR